MSSKTKGSYEGWNEVWSVQSEQDLINTMYFESEPKTIFLFWQQGYANDLLKLIKDRNYASFCELGSGRGTTSMFLAKAGFDDITMVDLAEQGFKMAKFNFGKYNLPIPKMILQNVENTSLPDKSFDCIYNIGLLEHFDNPRPTLIEAYRLLKQEGMIFMPIVPTQPLYKSFFQRLLFNPLALFKLHVKKLLRYRSHSDNINRTDYRRSFYENICKDLGYKNVHCIPYNPYWKVNSDGKIENSFTLPIYKWYYKTFKRNKILSFETSSLFDLCFLLVAEK